MGLSIWYADDRYYERDKYLGILKLISKEEMKRLFEKAAELGVGIELNVSVMKFDDKETDIVLRSYRIEKECGCKFYLASDAHHPNELDDAITIFDRAIALLELTEEDKYVIASI